MPLVILGTDVTLICHRRRARLSPRTMAPSPSKKNSGLAKPTLADVYRMVEELFDRLDRKLENLFDRSDKKLDERAQEMSVMDQRASSLKQDARQPRLAIGADGQADTNTRERTEGAATTVQAMHGDRCFANRVDPDRMCSTSFGGDSTGPPTLPCSGDDALVGKGAAAPKSCLSPLNIPTTIAAGGLFPPGETSTATSSTFDHSTLWFCEAEETIWRT